MSYLTGSFNVELNLLIIKVFVVVAAAENVSPTGPHSDLFTYFIAIVAVLLTVAVVIVVALVCYYRRRVRKAAGTTEIYMCKCIQK